MIMNRSTDPSMTNNSYPTVVCSFFFSSYVPCSLISFLVFIQFFFKFLVLSSASSIRRWLVSFRFLSHSIKIRRRNRVDHMNQAIDIIIPCMIGMDGGDNEDEKIIDLSGYGSKTRPLYLIKRQKDIASIRKDLSMKKRVLLRTFNSYAYYSCDIAEIQQKVHEHMTNTGAYSLIMELDTSNRHCIDTSLNDMDKRVRCTLNTLLHDRSITFSQWQQMKVDRLESRLDSLYFLPNTRRVRALTDLSLSNSFSLNIGKCFMAANAQLSPWFNK